MEEQLLAYENRIKELEKLLAEKEAAEHILQNEKADLQNEKADLQQKNFNLQEQIAWLKKKVFGSQSERTKKIKFNPDQMTLFDEAEAETELKKVEDETPKTTVKAHTRNAKKERKINLDKLETREVIEDLSDEEKTCIACGNEMIQIGTEYVRTTLDIIPAKAIATKHYRKVYKCPECYKDDIGVIKKAEVEPAVIPHSPASPTSLAHVIVQKYQLAVPLNRQQKFWNMIGVDIGRATLANWIIYSYRDYLKPLYEEMHRELLKEKIIHADETEVQVMKEKGRKNTQKSYMWLYSTGKYAKKQIRLYEYQPSRSGDCAAGFLEGFHGYLHTDGYSGYNNIPGATSCCCWSHARRKFIESIPDGIQNERDTFAGRTIEMINELFGLEHECELLPDKDSRYEYRMAKVKPYLERIFEFVETIQGRTLSKSKLSKAVNYILGHKDRLSNFLLDGDCVATNNLAERSIKPFVIGRKNWLFAGSPRGAKASAAVYSILETCIMNDIVPYDYFVYIFENISKEKDIHDPEIIKKYLPWNLKNNGVLK